MAVQATDSDIYLNNGKKVPSIEYEIWGEQAKEFAKKMESGLFIMEPDTTLAGAVTLVAPTIENVTTTTHNSNDGKVTLPTTLRDSKDAIIKVTSTLKTASGAIADSQALAPGIYVATFSAPGYTDVSAGFAVTNHP